MPSSLPKDFYFLIFIPLLTKEKILNLHTHMRVQGLCDDRRRKKTDEIWNSNRPRSFSSWPSLTERRERVRRLAHKFIHPILFKKRSLRKERGKFFRIWLLLITHRRTVWGCCEMGGRGPFLFLFFARAFWRAAAGVKAGPAATTTLLLAIQGLCSSAFFCFFVFFQQLTLTRRLAWRAFLNGFPTPKFLSKRKKIHNSGQCGRESRDFSFSSNARDVIPFPRFQNDFSLFCFVFFLISCFPLS